MDYDKYQQLSTYLINKAESISEGLPWTVKLKLLNDMMGDAATYCEKPTVLKIDKERNKKVTERE